MSIENKVDSAQLSWRGIILFGLNTATYKIALGQALAQLSRKEATNVLMEELAKEFFHLYLQRLREDPRPQLSNSGRKTVMERIVESHLKGEIDEGHAISRVAKDAFGDVISRFHTIGHMSVPEKFYEKTDSGIILTDSLHELFHSEQQSSLTMELEARWDLLEAAFLMRQPWMIYEGRNTLKNDTEQIFLGSGAFRTNITWLRKMLTGYQQDRCFYCG